MHCHLMVYIRIILTTLVTITCLLGDNFVEITGHPLLKALGDNATHAIIGALTGIAFAVQFYDKTTNLFGWFLIFLCFSVSSLIDLDHFIEAKSMHLEDATSISRRPFMHCSSIIIVILIFYLCTACLNFLKSSLILGALLCAFVTHHTRDAVRRGYWLCPFGHTERVPYVTYIILTVLTPHVIYYMHCLCRWGFVQKLLGHYVKLNEVNYRSGNGGYSYLPV